jgi:hypothetical protein
MVVAFEIVAKKEGADREGFACGGTVPGGEFGRCEVFEEGVYLVGYTVGVENGWGWLGKVAVPIVPVGRTVVFAIDGTCPNSAVTVDGGDF